MPSPPNPENADLIATDSMSTIAPDPATANTLSELNATLNELQPLASKIADLKNETLERETAVLKSILEKVTHLVPLLSEDCGQHYRREIVILTRVERVPLEDGLGFFSEHRLILYENGLLGRTHCYGEWSEYPKSGWENTDEDVITLEAAITIFGLTDISMGLTKALVDAPSMVLLKKKLEGRLAALTRALEALQ